MMATWSRMQQVCATCRFWQGQRKIDAWGEFYEAIDDLGQCCNWEGGFNQTTTSEGGYCSDWESYKKN